MSLDVYLRRPETRQEHPAEIWIREDGQQQTITRAEWDARYPGREPVRVPATVSDVVYHANITHNLGAMAEAAGLYQALWRPEECGWRRASDVIEPLRAGIARLESDPAAFAPYAPANGWGTYGVLLAFSKRYLAACEQWPDAVVEVSR